MKSQGVQIVNHAESRRKRRGLACLLWGFGASLGLLLAGVIVIGAVYAGWNTGLATARAGAARTAEAYAQQQCDHIPADLLAGNLRLAQSRFEDLANLRQTPVCLPLLAPTATAAYLAGAASPTTPPTNTFTPTALQPTALQPTTAATATVTATMLIEEISADYDLDSLLAEAQSALRLRDFPSAIDTLDAIISIDGEFQRELVRRLFLEALTAQALALYRSGRLSEAIVMTDRAEEQGSIEDLYHERYIALLYLDGQRYITANPAEAVRIFSSMYYEFGVRDYVNGPIAGDLQEAHRNYAMALALQGDHCPAQAQFEAALELRPAFSRINLADLTTRRNQSIQACQAQRGETVVIAGATAQATPQVIAPVGHSG